jgi:hypothetical protein
MPAKCLCCLTFRAWRRIRVNDTSTVRRRKRAHELEPQAEGNCPVTDALERRVLALRRAYQRKLARRPTTIEKTLLVHAAVTTARAEQAAADPHISANDFRALDSAARRARNEFDAVTKAREPVHVPLRERLRELAGQE